MQEISEKIKKFYAGAEMSVLDYMTAKDICELSGYKGDAALFAVLTAMFCVLQEGSLCMKLDRNSLCDRLRTFMEVKKAKQISDQFLSGLKADKYKNIIAKNIDTYLPLISVQSKKENLLYFQKFYFHENRLKNKLKAFLRKENQPDFSIKENILEEIFSDDLVIRVSKKMSPVQKDRHQIKALKFALCSSFTIISGGPGTGKTSVVVNILRCLVRNGIDQKEIILAAPTGRAAQRITEAIQNSVGSIRNPSALDLDLLKLKGNTLHKILRYNNLSNDFYYNDTNPLPAKFIIIDEVSMIDIVMMEKFLSAIDPDMTNVILSGDKDQLPSVDAGAVFAEMIPDKTKDSPFKDRLIVLKKVYRSGSGLLNFAEQINKGKCPDYSPVLFDKALRAEYDTWSFVLPDNINKWKQRLRLWISRHYFDENIKTYKELILEAGKFDIEMLANSKAGNDILEQIFSRIEMSRILTILRNGIYGCSWINSVITQYLVSELGLRTGIRKDVFSGSVIMITKNDYSKQLFNGDIGVIIKSTDNIYSAFFKRSGSYVFFDVDFLPEWQSGFALTVHKSQGTEFDDVLLVLPGSENNRLLTREIIYTGISRAKKRVVIYGSEPAFKNALQRKIVRRSGLTW